MTSREELIEEAARVIRGVYGDQVEDTSAVARAVFAVFEKAYKVSNRDLQMASLPVEEEFPQYFAPKPPMTTNRFES